MLSSKSDCAYIKSDFAFIKPDYAFIKSDYAFIEPGCAFITPGCTFIVFDFARMRLTVQVLQDEAECEGGLAEQAKDVMAWLQSTDTSSRNRCVSTPAAYPCGVP